MDRGKPGSEMHVLSDANGLPLLVGISAGNAGDTGEAVGTPEDAHRR